MAKAPAVALAKFWLRAEIIAGLPATVSGTLFGAARAVEQLSKIAKLQKADLIKFSSFESVLNHLFNGVDQIIKGGYARIAVQAWGEAQTDANIKKIAVKQIKIIRQDMSELARHRQEAGLVDANSAADEIGKVIFGFIPGYILQLRLSALRLQVRAFHWGWAWQPVRRTSTSKAQDEFFLYDQRDVRGYWRQRLSAEQWLRTVCVG